MQEGHSGAPAPCRHIGRGACSTAWTHQVKAMAEPTARRGGYRTWAQCPCLKPEFPLRAEAELQHPRDGGSEGEARRLGSPCSCSTTSVWHGSLWQAEPGGTLPATASSTQARGRELSWCLVTTSRECSAGELCSLCPSPSAAPPALMAPGFIYTKQASEPGEDSARLLFRREKSSVVV